MLHTCSKPISKDLTISVALDEAPRFVPSLRLLRPKEGLTLVGWGNKPSTRKSREWAKKYSIPYSQLEDGFISYTGHPNQSSSRLSIIHDKSGIYYDARKACDLDRLIADKTLSEQNIKRIQSILRTITQLGITKYNHIPNSQTSNTIPSNAVLIIDQTKGDASIEGALTTEADFFKMVETAKTNHPDGSIYLKIHPDILLGKKQGVIHSTLNSNSNIKLLPPELSTHDCLSRIKTIYTVCSQMGLEALWYGCKVYCFGMPFYAGRGLTVDTKPPPEFRAPTSLETLSYVALIDYCHYVHPETHQPCEIEAILSLIGAAKKYQSVNRYPSLYALDFSFWKRRFFRDWLNAFSDNIVFTQEKKAINKASDSDALLIWGSKSPSVQHPHILRVEDGFIRSKGLGIDLTPPLSLVFDSVGIYFDATRPSHLENQLASIQLTNSQKERAANLRNKILKNRISKYNLGEEETSFIPPSDKKILLIPGQVDNDASIRLGDLNNTGILNILKQARENNPEAFIIYRPHPDVLTGERAGVTPEQAQRFADHIDTHTHIHSAIEAADEIHVLTSLVGFEALLQKKTVVCYGMPFYAGWGLTKDKLYCERRGVTRSLEDLIYLTLVDYAAYLHPETLKPTTVENIIDWLAGQSYSVSMGIGFFGRLKKKIISLLSL